MIYETSYSSGRKPFLPDLERGSWQQPTDFIYACLGLVLNLDAHILVSYIGFEVGMLVTFLISMIVYVLPLIIIQCFLGQFSSSGFISALRMSPIFKGIGYVGIILGLYFLMHFSIIFAVPIIFLINSFRPTLPWYCEGWPNITDAQGNGICSGTTEYEFFDEKRFAFVHVPSVQYFRQHFENTDFESMHIDEHEFSVVVIAVILLVWAIIAYVFYGYSETAKFGTLLRYSVCLTLVLALVSFLALLQLPNPIPKPKKNTKNHNLYSILINIPFTFLAVVQCTLRSLGTGWGSIISLSSFNNFKTDIMRYSWLIAAGQTLIVIFTSSINAMIFHYFRNIETDENMYVNVTPNWTLFLSSGTVFASLRWANLWSIIYYTMMTLSSLILVSTQLFTILKSLFDEFEALRSHKKEVTFGLIGFLALTSVYFTSNHAVENYSVYSLDSSAVQLILHVLLLVAVLWVYGRERLQRDMEFMLSVPFSTWKVNVIRFLGMIVIIFLMLGVLDSSYYEHKFFSSYMHILSVFLVLLPFLLIPGYGIYQTLKTTGGFTKHLKNASKPMDWYPIDGNERQRYEKILGHNVFTQQLCDDAPEDAV